MSRYAYVELAKSLADHLPPPDQSPRLKAEFWTTLEVDARAAAAHMSDYDFLDGHLSSLGVGGLRVLSCWFDLDPELGQETLTHNLALHLLARAGETISLNIILLNDFLYRRRPDAIESIADLLLSEEDHEYFNLLRGSRIDAGSKRFLNTLLVFVRDPEKLRQMMLYESAERAGYGRYKLQPRRHGLVVRDEHELSCWERLDEVARQITKGAPHLDLTVSDINGILEEFESGEDGQQSRCYEVFHDPDRGLTLIFIFRYFRPWYIQQVQDVVFGDEAELIVLRLFDEARSVDAHAISSAGVDLASAIATHLFDEPCVEYQPDPGEPRVGKYTELLEILANDLDPRLRLQELFIRTAPLSDSPRLILRCEQDHTLKDNLIELGKIGLDLMRDPGDFHRIGIGFDSAMSDRQYFYRFSVYSQPVAEDEYYLTYTAANIATAIRAEFEKYLRDTYGVVVIPGTAETHHGTLAS